ncbi:MAG: UDP-3-O-[3-hydroxymyristoyl] N-acetylglucosamine deacetylase [Pirellulales bacterium]|nr:UDP-3-O-[3-hydroxymyristoyl] N-acetylglucosamine deacetylase [Pirellulales bacterium]
MITTRKQRTIADSVAVEGFGYWSGRDVRVEFCPAEENTGVVFVRQDLPGQPRIPARAAYRNDTPLRSNLECGGATVEMVEHMMATLGGLQIDNCEIRVDAAEMPGCDGSCLPFVEAIDTTKIVTQDAPRRGAVVCETIRASRGNTWIELRPPTDTELSLDYTLDFGPGPIGYQRLRLTVSPDAFRRELAPSRTFLMQAEAEQLRSQGLGTRARFSDLLVFGPDGPIDNTLRFKDECVRHKILDLIGDLALADCDLIGSVIASRSGHHLNAKVLQTFLTKSQTVGRSRRCA